MKQRTPVFIASRYIRGRNGADQSRKKLIGAVAGIIVSLIPLLLVMHVADGMIEGITRRYVEIGTFHIQVRTYREPEKEVLNKVIGGLKKIPEITNVYQIRQGTTIIYSTEGRTGAVLRALPDNIMQTDEGFRKYMKTVDGKFSLSAPDSVLVSTDTAKKLNVKPGDSVRILTTRTFPGRPPILRPTTLHVAGVFTSGYRELDALTIYIPQQLGEKLLQQDDSLFLALTINDPYGDMREIMWKIRNTLPQGWYVYSWYELEMSMYKSLATTKNLLIFIMILILLVASVNISSTIVMMVMERQKEIALLKSIGASPKIISRTFLYTGFFIGLTGTVIGILLGILISVNINEIISFVDRCISLSYSVATGVSVHKKLLNPDYYLEKIPVHVRFREIASISALSLLLSIGAAYFPARKAGKLRPLDTLRRF